MCLDSSFQELSSAISFTLQPILGVRLLVYHFQRGKSLIHKYCPFECNSQFFHSSFPFNWKNPIGYSIAVAWEYTSIFILIRFLGCLVPLVLACFFFAFSITNDWKGDLRKLNEMANTKHPSEAKIFKQLIEFIRSHSNAKQLSELYTSNPICVNLFSSVTALFLD